jgi:transposase InsO family protein
MEIFCFKCKKKTDTIDPVKDVSKNNKPMIKGKCKICGTIKCKFVRNETTIAIEDKPKIKVESKSKSIKITKKPIKIKPKTTDDILREIYFDPKRGISGINDLQRKTGLPQKVITEFLHKQETPTKHHPVKNKFQRERVYVHYPDQQWQSDLGFMKKYSHENKGYKYFLTIIDCFSKYAWTFPLKNKKPEGIVSAFKEVFKNSHRHPEKIQVDEGTEFKGKFNTFCKEHNVDKFSTENRDIKAQMAERFNQTIENKMEKVMTEHDDNVWYAYIEDLTTNYDNSYHRSIKMTPVEASKEENIQKVHNNLYPPVVLNKKIPKYNINDRVRVKINKKIFDKGYEQNFGDEVCKVYKINKTNPITYKLKNSDDNVIKGKYYEEELVLYLGN